MRNPTFVRAITAAQDRLREPLWWIPFPALIGLGLVIVLLTHVALNTNSRMGNPADILAFPAAPHPESAIWLSVTPIGDDIVVTTSDRQVFRWRQDVRTVADIKPLVDYLRQMVRTEIEGAALMNTMSAGKSRAVIAADQKLKYLHIRPIIYALAEAGIARYGFETLSPRVAAAEPMHDKEGHSGEIH